MPDDLDRTLLIKQWTFPDGFRILELSTRCPPEATLRAAAQMAAVLRACGVALTGPRQTKTRAMLDFFRTRPASPTGHRPLRMPAVLPGRSPHWNSAVLIIRREVARKRAGVGEDRPAAFSSLTGAPSRSSPAAEKPVIRPGSPGFQEPRPGDSRDPHPQRDPRRRPCPAADAQAGRAERRVSVGEAEKVIHGPLAAGRLVHAAPFARAGQLMTVEFQDSPVPADRDPPLVVFSVVPDGDSHGDARVAGGQAYLGRDLRSPREVPSAGPRQRRAPAFPRWRPYR